MRYSTSLALSVLVAFTATVSTRALTDDEVAQLKSQLNSTPPPELPAVAAAAVSKAKGADKDQVANAVINAVAAKRPTSLPAVVGSIAAAAPGNASKAAAQAAKVSPSQATSIVAAAANAAPAHSDEITGAVQGGTKIPAENRPPVTPGNIHGNRPTIPPGLAKKPYGSP